MSDEPLDPNNEEPPLGAGNAVGFLAFLKDLTYKEIHLFAVGAGRGVSGRKLPPNLTVQGRAVADSWYAFGGFFLGRLLLLALVLAGATHVTGAGILPI